MNTDSNRKIAIGITGTIAAYKAVLLARKFQNLGFVVQFAVTHNALEFVGLATLEGISGEPVVVDTFEPGRIMDHIFVPDSVEALVIAPCSANMLSSCANGRADNVLSTMYLASTCPVVIAPAMNVNMWQHPATKRNVAQLVADGVHLVEPQSGELACGWQGAGRFADEDTIAMHTLRALAPHPLSGARVLINGGATREFIDPVRFLSNPSSGKMACALAKAAWIQGAHVHLVMGEGARELVNPLRQLGINIDYADSAAQMLEATEAAFDDCSIAICSAAVSDYTTECASHKTKKSDGDWDLRLHRTQDIVRSLAQRKKSHQKVVGFAAETTNVEAYAQGKLNDKNLDAIVFNDVSDLQVGFGSDYNSGGVILSDTKHAIGRCSKDEFANQILGALQAAWGRWWE